MPEDKTLPAADAGPVDLQLGPTLRLSVSLSADNARLRGLIAEAVEDMGRGGTCIHAGLKGRMVHAMTPNIQVQAGTEAGEACCSGSHGTQG